MKTLLQLVLIQMFALINSDVFGQWGVTAGLNTYQARQHSLVGEIQAKPNVQFGANWTSRPFSSIRNLGFRAETQIISKGYRQKIRDEIYSTTFSYWGLMPTVRYQIVEAIGIHSGFELNFMIGTNSENGISLYRAIECAAVFGLDIVPQKTISYFLRGSYGLTPVLNYPVMDPIEGIIGQRRDLYLFGFLAGVQININNR